MRYLVRCGAHERHHVLERKDGKYGRHRHNARAGAALGDTAPDLVRLTDHVLFGDVWANPGLSPRDRSLVTVAALVSLYRTDQPGAHLQRGLANGLTKNELVHAITHSRSTRDGRTR